MFNYHIRQYIFRQTNGEIRSFFCDAKNNLCCSTLTRNGIWSNAVALHKNAHQCFHVDMDLEDTYHIAFQDINGNIFYSRLDEQSIKTVPVLSSKSSTAYDKNLHIIPFKNNLHLFYVLQHNNSFLLAHQQAGNAGMGAPGVVDYVSGSSLPCSIVNDAAQNIYAFYQSYDGKYLQIGYKKLGAEQARWSDFTPVTRFAGNCEYPHALIDGSGIIHLCYQRRTPKFFEMVYQQKPPDKNLWSPEIIVHSSVHSFENASILQIRDKIVVYWVREDIIYFNAGSSNGANWGKPSRYGAQFGRQLQCLGCKSNSPKDRAGGADAGDGVGDASQLPPGIYPGLLTHGLKLAFVNLGADPRFGDGSQLESGDGSQLFQSGQSGDGSQFHAQNRESGNAARKYTGALAAEALAQLRGDIAEIREGWSENKKEMSRLTNVYMELLKEINKFGIRLNMIEKQLGFVKSPAAPSSPGVIKNTAEQPQTESTEKKSGPVLDPEKQKAWEEWKEPEEWGGV